MTWIPQLTALRNRLATLIPQERDARRVVEEAQLNPIHIDFDSKAINNWHSILNQAHLRDKVEAIVQAAVNACGNDAELLAAYQAYMAAAGKPITIFLTQLQAPSVSTMPPSITQSGPIKILFLAANPREMDQLQLDEEVHSIDDALQRANYREHFDLKSHWAVRRGDLQELLLRYMPHIVHFAGHGDESGRLLLLDAKGEAQPVSPQALASLFALLKDNIRCVVLIACYTDALAQGIAQSIDFVLGMSRAFSDTAAVEFAAGFYTGLGWGRTIQVAFEMGRNRIELAGLSTTEQPKLTGLRTNPTQFVLHSDASMGLAKERSKIDPLSNDFPIRSNPTKQKRLKELLHQKNDLVETYHLIHTDLMQERDAKKRAELTRRINELQEAINDIEQKMRTM